MAVQYKANAKTKIGGAGSGSLNKGDKGPIITILIGNKIVDTVLFHPVSDSVLRKDSPLSGMSRTTDRKVTL